MFWQRLKYSHTRNLGLSERPLRVGVVCVVPVMQSNCGAYAGVGWVCYLSLPENGSLSGGGRAERLDCVRVLGGPNWPRRPQSSQRSASRVLDQTAEICNDSCGFAWTGLRGGLRPAHALIQTRRTHVHARVRI